jgi:hypothetical protein
VRCGVAADDGAATRVRVCASVMLPPPASFRAAGRAWGGWGFTAGTGLSRPLHGRPRLASESPEPGPGGGGVTPHATSGVRAGYWSIRQARQAMPWAAWTRMRNPISPPGGLVRTADTVSAQADSFRVKLAPSESAGSFRVKLAPSESPLRRE